MKKNKKIYQAPVSRVITMDTSQGMLNITSGGTSNEALKPKDWNQEADGEITETKTGN